MPCKGAPCSVRQHLDPTLAILWPHEVMLADPEANIATYAVHWGGEGSIVSFGRVL